MNVRLQYNLEFLGAVYYDDQLKLNRYKVNLSLVTNTVNRSHIEIAMDRLKVFVRGELENAVFINRTRADLAEVMTLMGINVVTLPDEPVDQIIGMMLFYKLNAIMENNMLVLALDIASELGDEVWYQHDAEDAAGPFIADGWWDNPSAQHSDVKLDTVDIMPDAWTEYGLNWSDGVDNQDEKAHTVVYANFQKNEN